MKDETHEKIYDEVGEYEMYEIEKWLLMKNNDVSVHLKSNSNIYMIFKNQM